MLLFVIGVRLVVGDRPCTTRSSNDTVGENQHAEEGGGFEQERSPKWASLIGKFFFLDTDTPTQLHVHAHIHTALRWIVQLR